jgi:hypothetical protein
MFTVFLVWLTTGSINAASHLVHMPRLYELEVDDQTKYACPLISPQDMMDEMDERFKQLLECYFLGDSLQAERFQNYIMDSIIDLAKSKHEMPTEGIQEFNLLAGTPAVMKNIYDRTSENSPLRKFLVEYLLFEGEGMDASEINAYVDFGLQDYISDVLAQSTKLYGQAIDTSPFYPDQCRYHLHSCESEDFVCATSNL